MTLMKTENFTSVDHTVAAVRENADLVVSSEYPILPTLSPWASHQNSPPLHLLLLHPFSFSSFLSHSLSPAFSMSLAPPSLPPLPLPLFPSLFFSLRQMPIPSKSQLGARVHGFQMFSRDERG